MACMCECVCVFMAMCVSVCESMCPTTGSHQGSLPVPKTLVFVVMCVCFQNRKQRMN